MHISMIKGSVLEQMRIPKCHKNIWGKSHFQLKFGENYIEEMAPELGFQGRERVSTGINEEGMLFGHRGQLAQM